LPAFGRKKIIKGGDSNLLPLLKGGFVVSSAERWGGILKWLNNYNKKYITIAEKIQEKEGAMFD
jgi:hypothetical protein